MKRELHTSTDRFTLKERLRERRYVFAGNSLTPVDVLVDLACDKSVAIRRRVAENPRTPIEVLQQLSRDADCEVRVGVCDNHTTPPGLLLLLAMGDDADVRYAIAENANAPAQILCLLTRDENPYIAERAIRTMALLHPVGYPKAA